MAKNGPDIIPDAYDAAKKHPPKMLTTDLALRFDPAYEKISRRFLANPDQFAKAFAQAWFKLTHRDMGPRVRYLGPEVPAEEFIWQDPIPAPSHIHQRRRRHRPEEDHPRDRREPGPSLRPSPGPRPPRSAAATSAAAPTAAASGSRRRRTSRPTSRSWARCWPRSRACRSASATCRLPTWVVLAGTAAVEKAARDAGHNIEVPFTPGRADASQEQTDVESVAYLETPADGFRNYGQSTARVRAEEFLVDKAQLLTLTAPEMTLLVAGLRALGANYDGSSLGVLTTRPGQLTNDFFVNLLDTNTAWKESSAGSDVFVGTDRKTGQQKWTATRVDLVFGSQAELRAVAEVYASSDSKEKFVHDFVHAWVKVMNLDRFDVK